MESKNAATAASAAGSNKHPPPYALRRENSIKTRAILIPQKTNIRLDFGDEFNVGHLQRENSGIEKRHGSSRSSKSSLEKQILPKLAVTNLSNAIHAGGLSSSNLNSVGIVENYDKNDIDERLMSPPAEASVVLDTPYTEHNIARFSDESPLVGLTRDESKIMRTRVIEEM